MQEVPQKRGLHVGNNNTRVRGLWDRIKANVGKGEASQLRLQK